MMKDYTIYEDDYEENFQNYITFEKYKKEVLNKNNDETDSLKLYFNDNENKILCFIIIINQIIKKIVLKRQFKYFNNIKFEFFLIKKFKTHQILKRFLKVFNRLSINNKKIFFNVIKNIKNEEKRINNLNKKLGSFMIEKNKNKELLREEELNFEKIKIKEKKLSKLPPPNWIKKKINNNNNKLPAPPNLLKPPMMFNKKIDAFMEKFKIYPSNPENIKKVYIEKLRGIEYEKSFWKIYEKKLENEIKNFNIDFKELEIEFKSIIKKENVVNKSKNYLLETNKINNIEIIIKRFSMDVYEFMKIINENKIKQTDLHSLNLFKKIVPNDNEINIINIKLKENNYPYDSSSEKLIKTIINDQLFIDKLNIFIMIKEFKNIYKKNFNNINEFYDTIILIENDINFKIYLRFLLKIVNWLNYKSKNQNNNSITIKNIRNLKNVKSSSDKNLFYFCIKYINLFNNKFFNFINQYDNFIYNKIQKKKEIENIKNELIKIIDLINDYLKKDLVKNNIDFYELINKYKENFLFKYNKFKLFYDKFINKINNIKLIFGFKNDKEIDEILMIIKEIIFEIKINLDKIEEEESKNSKYKNNNNKYIISSKKENIVFDPQELKNGNYFRNKVNQIKNKKKKTIQRKKSNINNEHKLILKKNEKVNDNKLSFNNKGVLKFN